MRRSTWVCAGVLALGLCAWPLTLYRRRRRGRLLSRRARLSEELTRLGVG